MRSIVAEQETREQRNTNPYTNGEQWLAFAEFLLLGLWLGAMCFFSFAVAPSAFAVLPSRHFAGLIVGSTLTKLEWLGLISGGLLLILHFIKVKAQGKSGRTSLILLLFMVVATAALRFWISPAMNAIRLSMSGAIDDLTLTDPLRVQFNQYHQYSVWLMGTTILAGAALLFINVRSWFKQ
jgi:hypothetical protein